MIKAKRWESIGKVVSRVASNPHERRKVITAGTALNIFVNVVRKTIGKSYF